MTRETIEVAPRRAGPLLAVILTAVAIGLSETGAGSPSAAAPRIATPAPAAPPAPRYERRAVRDPDGTGKVYLGREIAQVMGAGAIPWLDRAEREVEERPERVLEALALEGDEVVADLGAGSGYYTFRLARRLPRGAVLAVELQEEMLTALRERAAALGATNVGLLRATPTDPRLPPARIDVVLMVDVYHELEYPWEVMRKVHGALKSGGRVVLVEYRAEDPDVPIKPLHTMSEAQIRKEMRAAGFTHLRTVGGLPWQHIVIFTK